MWRENPTNAVDGRTGLGALLGWSVRAAGVLI
jgi:hypothetical protein